MKGMESFKVQLKKKESLVKVATLLRVGMQSVALADASHDTLSHFMIIWVRPHLSHPLLRNACLLTNKAFP